MTDRPTKSARRVFEILELFSERRCPLRLKDVAGALGMPTSSTAALLKTMAQLSYLSFEDYTSEYFPTFRFSQLGAWVSAHDHENGPVQEAMRRIERKVGETIILGTKKGVHVDVVDMLRASNPIQYYMATGTELLLIHSGVGWALLGRETDDEIARVHRRTLRLRKAERAIPSLDRLNAGIAEVRGKGYCLSRGMVARGVGVVGMAVATPPGHRPLAIGVAGPLARIEKNLSKIITATRAENAKLTQFVGEAGSRK